MQDLFDYIFYRIYRSAKEKGDSAAETNGVLLLSVFQFFILLDVIALIRLVYKFPFPPTIISILPAVFFALVNWFRYERKLDIRTLASKWENESAKAQRRNSWLINLSMGASVLIVFLYGLFSHG